MVVDVKVWLFCLLSICGTCAVAQTLPDPTRPAMPESAAIGTSSADQQLGVSSGLQSIIRRKGARPAALINGEVVNLGAKSGDATLVKIGDDYVVLKSPAGKQTLTLTPDIKKTVSKRTVKAASTKGQKVEE